MPTIGILDPSHDSILIPVVVWIHVFSGQLRFFRMCSMLENPKQYISIQIENSQQIHNAGFFSGAMKNKLFFLCF